jgi:hypothetical protein
MSIPAAKSRKLNARFSLTATKSAGDLSALQLTATVTCRSLMTPATASGECRRPPVGALSRSKRSAVCARGLSPFLVQNRAVAEPPSFQLLELSYYQSAVGVTPSNMGQSRVGVQGVEPLYRDWSAVFQVETFFNPQSAEIASSLRSLAMNNGRSPINQNIGVDGGSAGQSLPNGLRRV